MSLIEELHSAGMMVLVMSLSLVITTQVLGVHPMPDGSWPTTFSTSHKLAFGFIAFMNSLGINLVISKLS